MMMKMPRLRARSFPVASKISAMWVRRRPRLLSFMGFDAQGFVQRDGLDVFDGHFRGDGDDVAEFVELAHGVVEDGGDDAAVAVSGRAGVAFAQAEIADEAVPFLSEFQVHALGIVGPQAKQRFFFCG